MKKMLFLATFLAGSLSSFGAGLIVVEDARFWLPVPPDEVHPPRRIPPPRYFPPPRRWAPLEVSHVRANVSIKDQVATTSVDQEFYNPNSQQLEGTFLLPVPKGAHIDKFAMEIDGKQVHAELLGAEKARNIYEDILRKARDPALLEYSGRDLFKVRIFPIEPHSKKRISLSWTQVLKADAGVVPYVFPLNTEKFSAKPAKNVSVKVELESKRALKSVYSPSHKVEVKRHGDHKATVGYESTESHSDSDFQLFFSQEEGEFGANLLAYKEGDEDGYFLLLVTPSAELKSDKVMAKDVTFVLDTSGSMAGAKLEQAKKALLFCVENLNDNDRFEVIHFATEVEGLFDKLVEANGDNRARAQKFIKELKPTGGTAIDDALRQALSARASSGERPYVVVFLTDGRPTIGVTDEDQILKNVRKTNQDNTRIFVFGIGTDVNTHLLDKVADHTKAFSQYVLPEEDIEVKVSNFFSKIKEPVLANPKLTFPDEVRVTKIYPAPLPDLFKGEQLIVAGRYSGKGAGKLKVQGTVNGQTKEFTYEVKLPEKAAEYDFISRLWATRRVGYLLDEIRLQGDNKEIKDEVTELARKYNIVTPYTTYLIVEDERQRGLTENVRSLRLEDEVARESSSFYYRSLGRDRSGDFGVAGAQSTHVLKSADAPEDAVAQSRKAAGRPQRLTALPALTPHSAPAGNASPTQPFRDNSTLSRFVNGRTFYLNDQTWVDASIQKLTNATPVMVKFGSPEYFALIKTHPKASEWLAVGPKVRLAIAGRLYEVTE